MEPCVDLYESKASIMSVNNSRLRVEYSACVRVGTPRIHVQMDWMDYYRIFTWLNANVGEGPTNWQECSTLDGTEILIYLHSARHATLMAIGMSEVVLQVYTKDLQGTWT
jgi:hypothetical protein